MPPGDGITVTPAELDAHAGRVDAAAVAVGQARQAGAATAPGPDAYGRLCVIVPALLGQLQGMIIDGIAAAEDSLRDSAGRVQQAAAGYREADERAASGVRGAGRL